MVSATTALEGAIERSGGVPFFLEASDGSQFTG